MSDQSEVIEQLEVSLRAACKHGSIIGHFGAIREKGYLEGQANSWWSIVYDDSHIGLLDIPVYKVAQILSVLGSEVRLAILRRLLEGPKTAAEIVAEVGLNTTGQAYHHLRELERGGYVKQREGGRYHFDLKVGRIYLTALALAADAGAEEVEEEN